jgi:predicted nucleic acid-binding protein
VSESSVHAGHSSPNAVRAQPTRAWELRGNLTIYDGSYVALAELLDVAVITLDTRFVNAPGPRCPIIAYGMPDS